MRELTDDDAFAVGVVAALQQTPMLLFLPFTGLLADRFNKRTIMLCTQFALASLAFGLGALMLLGDPQLWQVSVFAFCSGTVASIDNPSRAVFVSELVPPEDLPNAVGLNSTSFNSARLIGPGLAGVLIALVGSGWVFVINGVSFVSTIFALFAMNQEKFYTAVKKPQRGHPLRRFAEGLTYVKRRGDLAVAFVVAGTVACLCMNYQITMAAMARIEFGLEAGEYGILGSILGVGSLAGALMAARRSRTTRVRTVVVAAIMCGFASLINASMPTYWSYAASLVLVGFTMLMLFTSTNTMVQVSTEPEIRGRVMSLYQTVIIGSAPIGSLVVSWLCQNVSPRWGIGIGAIAAFLVVCGAFLWSRSRWGVSVRYSASPRPHLVVIGPMEQEKERLAAQRADEAARIAREVAAEQRDSLPGPSMR